jgi:hypothetical protein
VGSGQSTAINLLTANWKLPTADFSLVVSVRINPVKKKQNTYCGRSAGGICLYQKLIASNICKKPNDPKSGKTKSNTYPKNQTVNFSLIPLNVIEVIAPKAR